MNTSERLSAYYEFDPDILETVGAVADEQNQLSFQELADRYGVADGPYVPETDYKPFEVLTFRPSDDYDEHHARVYHNPMAMSAGSMATRAMRLFAADPTSQLIVMGNPAAIGQRYGKLSHADRKIVRRGDLSPTVEPGLAYLESIGIESTDEIGFSYGADKAAAASQRAAEHGITVHRGVWMEPVTVVERGILQLAKEFKSCEPELKNYIAACDSPPLKEERELYDTGVVRYIGGIVARASNLAIAKALTLDGFEERVRGALQAQPNMKATIAWGTASELVPRSAILGVIGRLRKTPDFYHNRRLGSMMLAGMHHAGDDIDLHAAVVLQGLRNAA